MPAEADLRRFLEARGLSGVTLESEIRRIASQASRHALDIRLYALVMKQVAERFTAAQIRGLDPQTRAQWRAIVERHARVLRQSLAGLRESLSAFPEVAAVAAPGVARPVNDEGLPELAARIYQQALTVDAAVSTSFFVSPGETRATAVSSPAFVQALAALAEALSEVL